MLICTDEVFGGSIRNGAGTTPCRRLFGSPLNPDL